MLNNKMQRIMLLPILIALLFSSLSSLSDASAIESKNQIASISESIIPAVVSISVSQKQPEGSKEIDEMQEMMRDFFGRGFPFGNPGRRQQERKLLETFASGFIIDQSGYIITNYHVIANAEDIKVTLHDDTAIASHKAKVIGTDEKTDLAIIKIETSKPLKHLVLDASSEVNIGDPVIAVGNPLGVGISVTQGIISAKSRGIKINGAVEYLQTDATINRGNSGGPLCDMKTGRVIGINTAAMFSYGGGYTGIGFALPAKTAQSIISQIKNGGSVQRGWLGVMIQEVDEDIAKSINLPASVKGGAMLSRVEPDSPAKKAGLQSGDVIIKVDDEAVTSVRKVVSKVSEKSIGSTLKLELFSKGKIKTVTAKIEKAKDISPAAISTPNNAATNTYFGISVQNITADVAGSAAEGVVVKSVTPQSAAYDAGIQPGDLILGINQDIIKNVADFNKHAANLISHKKTSFLLLVSRRNIASFITIKIPLNSQ